MVDRPDNDHRDYRWNRPSDQIDGNVHPDNRVDVEPVPEDFDHLISQWDALERQPIDLAPGIQITDLEKWLLSSERRTYSTDVTNNDLETVREWLNLHSGTVW